MTEINPDEYKWLGWTACTLQDPDDYSIECEDISIDCGDCEICKKDQEDYEKEVSEHRAKYVCPECDEQKQPVQTQQKTKLITYEATRWVCVNPKCKAYSNPDSLTTKQSKNGEKDV